MTPTHRSHDMTDANEDLRAALLMITHKANEANIHRDEDDVLETIIETARAALAAAPLPSARDALQAIADLPTGRTEEVMEGQEQAYRAVEALFATPPQIVCSAAPQPMGCGLPCGFDCNGACFDAAAPQPAQDALDDAYRRGLETSEAYGKGWDAAFEMMGKTVPVRPEKESAIGDREALVEVIESAVRANRYAAEAIADALLARGLRLPVVCHEPAFGDTQAPLPVTDDTQSASGHTGMMVTPESLDAWLDDNPPPIETMAWAVAGEDGALTAINYDRRTARHLCGSGERVVRVAIRVVEGGDQ